MDHSELNLRNLKGEVRFGAPLSHLTWFKVGGKAEVLFKPFDIEDLANLIRQNNGRKNVTILGAGSNTIIRDGGIDGIVVKLGRGFTSVQKVSDDMVVASAACLNFNLANFCKEHSLTGLEFLVGIPGTVGGGIKMNAGAYGHEFKDIVIKIEGVNEDGNIVSLSNADLGFGYRFSNLPQGFIVTKVFFKVDKGDKTEIAAKMLEINTKRTTTQPVTEKTGGSTFANPEGLKAWELIDQAGMRGYRVGEAGISALHCNFMINHENATAGDLENLGELVRKKVLESSGIDLRWEIKIIGKK
jgi:UDP-N-acetylmuramate dehydrogenase